MKSDKPGRVAIGKIIGAHGVTGTLRLLPLTDFPERFLNMKTLTLEQEGRPARTLDILSIQPYEGKGCLLVRAAGITSRDDAEGLRGYCATVSLDERCPLEPDTYWIDDLIGLKVLDSVTEDLLGTVEDVLETGSNDVYTVRCEDGCLRMIPAIGEVIREIHIESGIMKVDVPEGLWD